MDPRKPRNPLIPDDTSARRPFVPIPYTPHEAERIKHLLNKVLGPEFVSSRPSGGGSVLYIEGWKALNLANEIFGFNGWNSELVSQHVDYIDTHGGSGRFLIGLLVVVRVTLRDGTFHEDFGYGYIDNAKTKAMAFEKCRKEALTDGIKRCLRCFGNVLGNCLYDKTILPKIKKFALPTPAMEDTDFYRETAIYDSERRKRRDTRTSVMESVKTLDDNDPLPPSSENNNGAPARPVVVPNHPPAKVTRDLSSRPNLNSNNAASNDRPPSSTIDPAPRPNPNNNARHSKGNNDGSLANGKSHRHPNTNQTNHNGDATQDTLVPLHRDPDTQTAREIDEMDFSIFSDEDFHMAHEPEHNYLQMNPTPTGQVEPPQEEDDNVDQRQNRNLGKPGHQDHLIAPVAIVSARDAAVVQDLPHAPPTVARFNHHFISTNIRRTIDQSRSGPIRRADIPASQTVIPPNKVLAPPKRLGMPPSQHTTKRLRSQTE